MRDELGLKPLNAPDRDQAGRFTGSGTVAAKDQGVGQTSEHSGDMGSAQPRPEQSEPSSAKPTQELASLR
jgi:hypothetical protein